MLKASSLSTCRPLGILRPPSRTKLTLASIGSETQGYHKITDCAKGYQETQTTRPDFEPLKPIVMTKSPDPTWTSGIGVTESASTGSADHTEVDPYALDRPMRSNYTLLISGIAPRPVGFLSTVSKDGKKNLAPFSYFQVVDHDPPMFIVGFSASSGRAKDTFKNLMETGECVINTVSEDMVEAMVATSIDAPAGVSEWEISGLTEAPSSTVAASRVKESVFSIEGKLVDIKELGIPEEGHSVAATALIKASRFWVRRDATNDEVDHIDIDKLRPIAQLGGEAYARISETFEIPRRKWNNSLQQLEVEHAMSSEHDDVKGTVEEAQELRGESGQI
jgi:flavin reductase (DIM6/NTAB) family NADH-FMN oxidoreductase RutF